MFQMVVQLLRYHYYIKQADMPNGEGFRNLDREIEPLAQEVIDEGVNWIEGSLEVMVKGDVTPDFCLD